jgi:predicted membrane metal-binding protein
MLVCEHMSPSGPLKFVGVLLIFLIALPIILIYLPHFVTLSSGAFYTLIVLLLIQYAIPYCLLVAVLSIMYVSFLSAYARSQDKNGISGDEIKDFFKKNGKL